MAFPIAAVAGLGLSAAGGALGARRATKAQRFQRRHVYGAAQRWRQRLDSNYGLAESQFKGALGAVRGATAGSLAESSRIGDSVRRRIEEQRTADEGALSSSLLRRGLFSSTVYDQARRNLRDQSQRSLLDLDDRLAQLRTGIIERGGAAEAGALGALGSFYRQRGQDYADIERSLMSYAGAGQVPQQQPFDLGGLADFISLFGGGGGGYSFDGNNGSFYTPGGGVR